MDDWKERLKNESKELKERLDKLHKWNVKQEASYRLQPCRVEKIEDDLSRDLYSDQEDAMTRYLNILELRAEIYGIELRSESNINQALGNGAFFIP